ncbi:MAG: PilZ domain-containing protein [Syntrophaceae bacterium]|nr:PilZ domain-containing protein [Syntrophaceae bacterium]
MNTNFEKTLEGLIHFKERRRYPRFVIDLPLEYQIKSNSNAHGGLVLNASEAGLLLYSTQDMPVGAKLKITVLFPKGFELANFEAIGEIIWKNLDQNKGWEAHQYGLKFIQISQEDHLKLRQVLNVGLNIEEMSGINEIQTCMATKL